MNPEDFSHEDAMSTAVRCQIALTVCFLANDENGRQAAENLTRIAGLHRGSTERARAKVAESLYSILRSFHVMALRAAIDLYGRNSAVAAYCEGMSRNVHLLPIEDIVFVLTQFRNPAPPFSEN